MFFNSLVHYSWCPYEGLEDEAFALACRLQDLLLVVLVFADHFLCVGKRLVKLAAATEGLRDLAGFDCHVLDAFKHVQILVAWKLLLARNVVGHDATPVRAVDDSAIREVTSFPVRVHP